MANGSNGDLYVLGTDEFEHSALSVWRVSGLDTIHEMSASGTLGGATIALTDSSGPVADWHTDQTGGTSLTDSSGNNNDRHTPWQQHRILQYIAVPPIRQHSAERPVPALS